MDIEKLARKIQKLAEREYDAHFEVTTIMAWLQKQDEDVLVANSPIQLADLFVCG